jgi:hypothetical protein
MKPDDDDNEGSFFFFFFFFFHKPLETSKLTWKYFFSFPSASVSFRPWE